MVSILYINNMLVYRNTRVSFGINILVAKVRFCYYVMRNNFRYATVNTMNMSTENLSSVYKEDKKNKHLNKWNDFLIKLDFHENVTAKGYEEHSGNCPGSGIMHRQAFIFWEVLIPIQKKYCSR